jgi:hypothetical protein
LKRNLVVTVVCQKLLPRDEPMGGEAGVGSNSDVSGIVGGVLTPASPPHDGIVARIRQRRALREG